MDRILFLITVPVIVFLQVGVLPAFFGVFPVPNLLFVLVIGLVFSSYLYESFWLAFFGGVLIDFFSSYPFGLGVFLLVLFAVLFSRIFRLIGSSVWIFGFVSCIFSLIFRLVLSYPSVSLRKLLLGAALDTAFSFCIHFLVMPVWKNIYQREKEQLSLKLDA